jgi:hypothetical protein
MNKKPKDKYDIKLTLILMLYRRGYNKKQIVQLFSFIDWLITLPKDLENKITDEIIKIEEVGKVTYVTNIERIGEKRGEKRGLRKVAKTMLEIGDSIEDIMKRTGLTREEILAVKKDME